MEDWVEAQARACLEAIEKHVAAGDRDRGRFGMKLVLSVLARSETLPSERREALRALGERLIRDAGPGSQITIAGLVEHAVLRESRDQLLLDIGRIFAGKSQP